MADESRTPTGSLKPIAESEWDEGCARHLLWRAGFGGTPGQVAYLAGLTPEKAVSALLDFEKTGGYSAVEPEGFDDSIMRPPSEDQRKQVRRARRAQDEDALAKVRLLRQQREQVDREQMDGVRRWWLGRLIESPRPMEEKLTLFWHGHFATSYRTIEDSCHMFMQNQLFRRQAAGNFGELLFAIIRDPAMLAYLDNNDSRKDAPNENLARELMELFSLGEGNYSEKDIKEGARALTGYSFEHNAFAFRTERHDEGTKSVLGRNGVKDGDDFVKAILAKREASEFITLKLYRFFVNELPTEGEARRVVIGVVKQLASTLVASRYELKPMLRRMLLSEHFYDGANRLSRIKGPVELVVGMVRSLGTPVRDLGILNDALDLMGQSLFYPPSVKGWDGGRSWMNTSTLFVRQNVANFLLTGKMPKGYDALAAEERYDFRPLMMEASERTDGAEHDPAALARYLIGFCLGRAMTPEKERAVAEYLASFGKVDETSVARTLALICASAEYQVC